MKKRKIDNIKFQAEEFINTCNEQGRKKNLLVIFMAVAAVMCFFLTGILIGLLGEIAETPKITEAVRTVQTSQEYDIDDIINIAEIPGVTIPVTGDVRPTSITSTAQYTGTIAWNPSAGTTFASGTTYTATITLIADSGYTLTGVPANFFIVSGANSVTNSADSGEVTAVFPATATTIHTGTIGGVILPVTGAERPTSVTPSATYIGTVTWSPSDGTTFMFGIAYTATITLTATLNFTTTGVGANAYMLLGSSDTEGCLITNNEVTEPGATTVTITAVFPPTNTRVSISAIGVTVPVVGEAPTKIIESAQYTGTTMWFPSVGNTFASATSYTVLIILTVKEGYTFSGVPSDFFTVAGAKKVMSIAVMSGVPTLTVWVDFFETDAKVTFSITNDDGMLSAAVDDIAIASPAYVAYGKSVVFTATPNSGRFVDVWKINGIAVQTGGNIYIHTISADVIVTVEFEVTDQALADEAEIALTWDIIRNGNILQTDVKTALTLLENGKHGATINWTSSDSLIIEANGTVNRPAFVNGSQHVLLTAGITINSVTNYKVFELIVICMDPTDSEAVENVKNDITWDAIRNTNVLQTDVKTALILLTLGEHSTTITWSSSNAAVITINGTVNRQNYGNVSVMLVATITKGTASESVIFTLIVPQQAEMDGAYKITFLDENGSLIGTIVNIEFGALVSSLTFHKAPEKADKIFVRWDGYFAWMTVTGNHTFTAVYALDTITNPASKYTVTFMSDTKIVWTGSVFAGTDVSTLFPNAPSKEGFIFTGWLGYIAGMTVYGDLKFHAMFEGSDDEKPVPSYIITFLNDDGSVMLKLTDIPKGMLVTLLLPIAPAKDSFTFICWEGYQSWMTVNGNHIFKAVYEPDTAENPLVKYTIKFIIDGAVIKEAEAAKGTDMSALFPLAPVKKGLVFVGWEGYIAGMKVYADHNFNAMFETDTEENPIERYTVKFVNDDGAVILEIKNVPKNYLLDMLLAAVPQDSQGRTFVGWNGYTPGMSVTGDLTLTALWDDGGKKPFNWVPWAIGGLIVGLMAGAVYLIIKNSRSGRV